MKPKREICSTETTFCIMSVVIAAGLIVADQGGLLPRTLFLKLYPLQFVLGLLLLLRSVRLYCAAVLYAQAHNRDRCADCPYYCGGVYARCRNPRCAAILFLSAGAFLINGNLLLLWAVPVLRILLSVLMHRTEREMEDICGASYRSYKRSVNRCIPMLRKEKAMSKV